MSERALALLEENTKANAAEDASKVRSTATYPNRVRDKRDLDAQLGFCERGKESIDTMGRTDRDGKSFRIAKGCIRVAYGENDVDWNEFPITRKRFHAYYDFAFSKNGGSKLYMQKRGVKHQPNPPPDGRFRTVRNNCREGYADYIPGMIYIDAFSVVPILNLVAKNNGKERVRKRLGRQRRWVPHSMPNSSGVKQNQVWRR